MRKIVNRSQATSNRGCWYGNVIPTRIWTGATTAKQCGDEHGSELVLDLNAKKVEGRRPR